MSVAAVSPARLGRWTPDPGFGVYVHIPFCRHRCHYCDFNTYEGLDGIHTAYVDALVQEIRRAATTLDGGARPATSVFFGGGTPTLLPPRELARVLDAVRDSFGLVPGAEITVEANPETVNEATFEELLRAGFNRVSIGVQSLVDRVLVGLGRTHGSERALAAIAAARRAGVDDVNADLIYGSQWETADDWLRSLEGVIESGCDHISAYALTVEEGTPLATKVATGRLPNVDSDVQAERSEVACATLAATGYERYEISNWAKPARASAHNVLYWCAGDYLGLGAGAHSHVAGRRSWSLRLPRDFIDAVAGRRPTEAGSESIAASRRGREALVLGLRLIDGVPIAEFAERFGHGCLPEIALAEVEALGLVERDASRVRLTERGTAVGNEVACRLI